MHIILKDSVLEPTEKCDFVFTKIWPTDLPKEAFEEMILAAANNDDQIVELGDGRRFKVTAQVIDPKKSAKDFLIKGGPLGSDEGFGN